jgi:hypothetical protein
MKILITCPRAPISIEWIKIAKQSSCEVILVDSLDYPISIFYDRKIPYVKVASPRLDFNSYKKEMEKLFLEVDIVIPNCEDIFFLSKIKDETNSKALFLCHKMNYFLSCIINLFFINILILISKSQKQKLLQKKRRYKRI